MTGTASSSFSFHLFTKNSCRAHGLVVPRSLEHQPIMVDQMMVIKNILKGKLEHSMHHGYFIPISVPQYSGIATNCRLIFNQLAGLFFIG